MIQTVIFDLGGVIVPLDFARLYEHISDRCGLPAAEVPKRIGATGLVPRLECGEISGEEFTQKVSAELGFTATRPEFRELWNTLFPPYTLIPEELLVGLRKKYRLLLLSNTNDLHFEVICERYPHMAHFDEYVLSYRVGAMKPSPRIYEEAVKAARCKAEDCFFTDDIAAYVEGARSAGMDAVRFEGYQQLVGEMERRGIAMG